MATLDSFDVNEHMQRSYPMATIKPVYSHDRTIVTVVVIICGTALLWNFGDQTPIVALVSSMWTLALTFWFRIGPDQSGDRQL